MPRRASVVPTSPPDLPTFHLIGNRTLEPGITVSHYEFYTTLNFSSTHKGQEVLKKGGGHEETNGFIVIYTKPGDGGYKGAYASANRVSFATIAVGITKEIHKGFIAWVFDNVGPEGMGAFVINHESPSSSNNFSTTINLGLDFTSSTSRRLSTRSPPGGFKPDPVTRYMSGKLKRLRDVCESQRDGILQKQACSICNEKVGRECRKVRGLQKCTWCRHFGRKCVVPGDDGRGATESIDGTEVDEDEDDEAGDNSHAGESRMTLRKSIHRKPSTRMLSLSDRRPLEIAGTKTLAGRIEKKKSAANLKEVAYVVERKKSAAELKHAMENFNIEDYRYPEEDDDDMV